MAAAKCSRRPWSPEKGQETRAGSSPTLFPERHHDGPVEGEYLTHDMLVGCNIASGARASWAILRECRVRDRGCFQASQHRVLLTACLKLCTAGAKAAALSVICAGFANSSSFMTALICANSWRKASTGS